MIAYELKNWIYTGVGVESGAIAPPGYTFVAPIACADDEVCMLIAGLAVAVKKSDLPDEAGANMVFDIDAARKAKDADFEQRRVQLERAGCPFVFGEVGDIIQTRDERDFININGVVMNATLLKSAGVSDARILFRAQSDTNYQLTPDQAIALGLTVAARSTQLYATKWALKDALESATTADEINAIHWPEN
jgi:hypothetical protein